MKCQHVSAQSAKKWIATKAWPLIRWDRGRPRPIVIAAYKRKLKCARSTKHRASIRRSWKAAKREYRDRRSAMLATRCGSPECNIALGWQIASKRGVSRSEFDGCLVPLWSKESGWDEQIWNTAGSGAGGIPQALPASKMGADANPNIGGWKVAAAQIKWGVQYIRERYGSPCGAWSFWSANHWY